MSDDMPGGITVTQTDITETLVLIEVNGQTVVLAGTVGGDEAISAAVAIASHTHAAIGRPVPLFIDGSTRQVRQLAEIINVDGADYAGGFRG